MFLSIGNLLALEFGEAGSEIIVNYINGGGHEYAQTVQCIFCFCDISCFNTVMLTLQDNVLTFVNQIADIVQTVIE